MPLLSQLQQTGRLLALQAQIERLAPIDKKHKEIRTFLGNGAGQRTPGQARLMQAARIQNAKSASSAQLIGDPSTCLPWIDHLQVIAHKRRKEGGRVRLWITQQNDSCEALRKKNLFDRPQFSEHGVLQRAGQFGDDGLEFVVNGEKSLVIHFW